MAIAAQTPIQVSVEPFLLDEANAALGRLRAGQIRGAAVLNVATG
jgi:D-arabinose 1-dehydrogenase-like Zn-dependent alcohol dehydrogenase